MSDKEITDSDITDSDDSDISDTESDYSDSTTDYDSDSTDSIDSKISDRSSCKSKIHTSKNIFKLYKQTRERLIESHLKNNKYEELDELGIDFSNCDDNAEKYLEEYATNAYSNAVNNTSLKSVWDSVDFTPVRETFYRESDMIMNPPNVVEGGFNCPRCGSTKTISYAIQRRSADEPMDSFVKCMNIKCMKLSRVN